MCVREVRACVCVCVCVQRACGGVMCVQEKNEEEKEGEEEGKEAGTGVGHRSPDR